ncbi:MAG TPA: response regulator transcription factor [Ferruginibacter sp.]|nr:response regulator transcription factor [Ferruginibacter sp.]
MKKITVVVVDDHQLIRQMWTSMFANSDEVEITGKCGTLNGAIEMIKIKRPDIVLLDINLVRESGLDAVPLIRKFSPGTRIIAVSMHNQPAYAKKMLQLGAKGYITKNSPFEEMGKAIEEVMKGNVYICAEIKGILSDQLNKEPGEPNIKDLTMREIEIIKLMKDGLSTKEISSRLNIGTRTVEVHRYNILKRLKLKNTASLINYINTTDLTFI